MDLMKLLAPILKITLGAFALLMGLSLALYGLGEAAAALHLPGIQQYSSPQHAGYYVVDGLSTGVSNVVMNALGSLHIT
ncbi:hypothetical protein IL38_23905 [Actinopolyspora erythraea]|uniref:Uncharacterized protein n=1 Tax=Actinopolyspora erythraea TaxID=414996 RepID=A0ABR4WYE8_9ACTN|nr:hypothetical protein [Actinopolyspora erythraea]KGI79351.1 hypothetical protein IL38_23905 [Actinopolyspora erythraea]